MASIINDLVEELEVSRSKNLSLTNDFKKLRGQYEDLLKRKDVVVTDNVELTNSLDKFTSIVSLSCLKCAFRGSKKCEDCDFRGVVKEYNLWDFS